MFTYIKAKQMHPPSTKCYQVILLNKYKVLLEKSIKAWLVDNGKVGFDKV